MTEKPKEEVNPLDTELAEVEKMSGAAMHEDEPEKVQEPEEPTKEEPKETAPKPEAQEPSQEKKEDPEEDKDPQDEEPTEEKPKEETSKVQPKRPNRYIPLPKYQAEKAATQKEIAELKQQLEQAQSAAGNPTETKEAAAVANESIEKYAEEHGFEVSQVQGLVNLISQSVVPPEVKELIAQQKADAEARAAEESFNAEWQSVENDLKKAYPDATPAQLVEAKKRMNELAHTEETQNTPLRYLLAGEKAQFDTIMGVDRPTFDQGRTGTERRTITADMFKDGKTSFDVLEKLETSERNQLISEMDLSTYDRYMTYVMAGDDMEIRRDGSGV